MFSVQLMTIRSNHFEGCNKLLHSKNIESNLFSKKNGINFLQNIILPRHRLSDYCLLVLLYNNLRFHKVILCTIFLSYLFMVKFSFMLPILILIFTKYQREISVALYIWRLSLSNDVPFWNWTYKFINGNISKCLREKIV